MGRVRSSRYFLKRSPRNLPVGMSTHADDRGGDTLLGNALARGSYSAIGPCNGLSERCDGLEIEIRRENLVVLARNEAARPDEMAGRSGERVLLRMQCIVINYLCVSCSVVKSVSFHQTPTTAAAKTHAHTTHIPWCRSPSPLIL